MEIDRLLRLQRESLDFFFDTIDSVAITHVVDILKKIEGTIYFTGVGKSGFICQKIASTLISTGTRAAFLSAIDALHGDIGMVQQGDIVLFLSKSGETEELLKLLPFIHGRNAETMAWTCSKDSRLAKQTTHSIELPLDKELCPFDLAPTTSAALQLLFGDAVAMALMNVKNISKDQYYLNHPAGAIGKKMSVRVEDIMLKGDEIPTLTKDATFKAAILLLTNTRKGCVLITNEEHKVEGIFTDGDVKRVLNREGEGVLNKTMAELMTSTFISLPKDITAWEAIKIMQKDPEKWVNVAPVTNEDLLVGLLRMHDVLRHGIR